MCQLVRPGVPNLLKRDHITNNINYCTRLKQTADNATTHVTIAQRQNTRTLEHYSLELALRGECYASSRHHAQGFGEERVAPLAVDRVWPVEPSHPR